MKNYYYGRLGERTQVPEPCQVTIGRTSIPLMLPPGARAHVMRQEDTKSTLLHIMTETGCALDIYIDDVEAFTHADLGEIVRGKIAMGFGAVERERGAKRIQIDKPEVVLSEKTIDIDGVIEEKVAVKIAKDLPLYAREQQAEPDPKEIAAELHAIQKREAARLRELNSFGNRLSRYLMRPLRYAWLEKVKQGTLKLVRAER